ncbi:hypothetical protein Cus16_0536 [Curtobacterium sp. ER1/6]|nr:hypothetical protein Cus16_0536 [Curtobacterium sp. ER1/6]
MGEHAPPQVRSCGREARPGSVTLVTVTTKDSTDHWCGAADPPAFARWLADRSAGCGAHLVPVLRAGRCPSGHPAVEVLRPPVHALDEALDVVGTPTEGVAVTLTVPLLQLAARARAGALELGVLSVEEIGVDEAGAVLVADRPPGAVPPCRDDSASGTTPTESVPVPVGRPTRSPRDADGSRQLVLAARTVWDRVDARAPVRESLDPVLHAAVDGGADDVRAALALVLAAAPPRPVRWTRPLGAFFDDGALFDDGATAVPGQDARAAAASTAVGTAAGAALVALARDLVERGIPVGSTRRLPVRHALVGTVVAGGLVAAAVGVR